MKSFRQYIGESHSVLLDQIKKLTPQLLAAAQQEYDAWDQSDPEHGDPELGMGGICQEIAEAMANVMAENGIDCKTPDNDGVGTYPHVWCVAYTDDEAVEVDINPRVYEIQHGWFHWEKRPGVTFRPEHLILEPIDRELVPDDF